MRLALVVLVLAGCGSMPGAADGGDGGPGAWLLCNDGYVVPICRCTSDKTTACAVYCSSSVGDGQGVCRASHGGLDGGQRFTTCSDAPSCS